MTSEAGQGDVVAGGRAAMATAVAAVGLAVGPLLLGIQPVGGDPDRLYRPIKVELARALRTGRLPLWSDRFGLGVPLLAESHVAALYPLNWPLYRFLDVPTAYRLAMWGHYLALASATFAYARGLGLSPWGGAVASVSVSLCGFQAIHSSHEPFYEALPYLPLVLLLADRLVSSGRARWAAGTALAWGAQLTLGHFQIQAWTAALALGIGGWRTAVDRRPWHRPILLALGLAGGAAIASAQLVPTWELARIVGQEGRSIADRSFFSFPPAHLAELAAPGMVRDLPGDPMAPYWFGQQTTGYESALYVGTIPLILAILSLVAGRRTRGLGPWRLIVPASLALATMPRWWPSGYTLFLNVPVLGLFRAPSRFTLLASFGLALLAGAGVDRSASARRERVGLVLAGLVGVAGVAWGAWWFSRPSLGLKVDDSRWLAQIGGAGLAWGVGLGAVAAWRGGKVGAWLMVVLTTTELAALYYTSTTDWGWAIDPASASPSLARLAREPGVRSVCGDLDNLPILAGRATAAPYLGFARLPDPNPMLALARPPAAADPAAMRWLRRFGVSHGAWAGPIPLAGAEPIASGRDPALDRLANRPAGAPAHRVWSVGRIPDPFPPVRAARRAVRAKDRRHLIESLSGSDHADEAWFLPGELGTVPVGPPAKGARVVEHDGRGFVVEHDGPCILVLTRAHYPGWTASIEGGPDLPIRAADGGLQAVVVPGSGTDRVVVRYRPTRWTAAVGVSLAATAASLTVLATAAVRRRART